VSDYIDPPDVLELFHSQLDLVDMIAHQVARNLGMRVEHAELVSAGREGLLDAARRYDRSRGVSFRTYANYRVRGAIFDNVRRMSAIPRRAWERLVALEAGTIVNEVGGEDLSLGVHERSLEPEEALFDQLDAFATAAATAAAAEPPREIETGEPSWEDDPEHAVERAQLFSLVRESLRVLSADESKVLRRYYFAGESLEEIAADMRVSRSWVSRLHTRAIRILAKRVQRLS
jgi:RNA polymerase sigma factor for flagellar operon FliA